MTSIAYCPQCGEQRFSQLRYCSRCRFDFDTLRMASPGAVTSLTRPAAAKYVTPAPPSASRVTSQPSQLLPVFAGVAWLLGAAALGYLAFLQLEYSSLELGDAEEARALALWNGVSAAVTAYFGAMAILSPTRRRMGGAVIWGVINVAWGAYQVSGGVTHPAFVASLVAYGLGGVLAFAAWSQLRAGESASRAT